MLRFIPTFIKFGSNWIILFLVWPILLELNKITVIHFDSVLLILKGQYEALVAETVVWPIFFPLLCSLLLKYRNFYFYSINLKD